MPEWQPRPPRVPGIYLIGERFNELDDRYSIAYVARRPHNGEDAVFYSVAHMGPDWRHVDFNLTHWWWWSEPLDFDRLPDSWAEHLSASV